MLLGNFSDIESSRTHGGIVFFEAIPYVLAQTMEDYPVAAFPCDQIHIRL
jgi:hypothetical protein